jgi:addiction module RelE/StbE family toxin
MEIKYHKRFLKSFRKRITLNSKLTNQFEQRLEKFKENPNDPILKDHKLTGEMDEYRAFSVSGDLRIIYRIVGDEMWLYDIGSHNQVY